MEEREMVEVCRLAEEVREGGDICLLQFSYGGNRQGCIITLGCTAPFASKDLILHPEYFDGSIREGAATMLVAVRAAVARWRTGELQLNYDALLKACAAVDKVEG